MKIRQLILVFLAIGLSPAAVAYNSTPSSAGAAAQSNWFIGGDAIYGKTGDDNSLFLTDDSNQYFADRATEWGFKTWAGYDAGNDSSYWVDWFSFHNTGKTSSAPLPGLLSVFAGALTGRQASDIDQISLQMARTLKNNNGTTIKIHAGPQVLLLNATKTVDLFVTASVDEIPVGLSVHTNDKSDFNGGGVVVGVDLEHWFSNSFSIFSRNQVGLAYGKLDSKYNLDLPINIDSIDIDIAAANLEIQKKYTVVPTLNAELGAAYNLQLANMDLRLEAGLRGSVVIDAVQNLSGEFLSLDAGDRYNWTEAAIFFGAQMTFSNLISSVG